MMRTWLFVLVLIGCDRAGRSDRALPPDLAAPPRPAPRSALAEVEISGRFLLPKGGAGATLRAFVTDGECWKPATRALADIGVTPTREFFAEVMVPQGSLVWVCAALVPPKGPIAYAGGLKEPLKGEGNGEVVFSKLDIYLAASPPVALPTRAAAAESPKR